jgi:uncharacterized protein YqfA (UPF0365 family)
MGDCYHNRFCLLVTVSLLYLLLLYSLLPLLLWHRVCTAAACLACCSLLGHAQHSLLASPTTPRTATIRTVTVSVCQCVGAVACLHGCK